MSNKIKWRNGQTFFSMFTKIKAKPTQLNFFHFATHSQARSKRNGLTKNTRRFLFALIFRETLTNIRYSILEKKNTRENCRYALNSLKSTTIKHGKAKNVVEHSRQQVASIKDLGNSSLMFFLLSFIRAIWMKPTNLFERACTSSERSKRSYLLLLMVKRRMEPQQRDERWTGT